MPHCTLFAKRMIVVMGLEGDFLVEAACAGSARGVDREVGT